MGYDLHITRTTDWLDSAEQPISREEWRTYVESDPELDSSKDDELSAAWYGEDGRPGQSECVGGFWWNEGRIVEKNPNKSEIWKMTQMATVFNARLVGDNDEEYRSNGEIYEERYVEKPPGVFKRLWAWWTGKSLSERESDWVLTGRWDRES